MLEKQTIRINRLKAFQIILSTKGRFFSAEFVKKDDTIRHINCRLGVKKNLKGGNKTVGFDYDPYVTVFDLHKKEYRVINLETLYRLYVQHKIYIVED